MPDAGVNYPAWLSRAAETEGAAAVVLDRRRRRARIGAVIILIAMVAAVLASVAPAFSAVVPT
jgi:hypothetical protein